MHHFFKSDLEKNNTLADEEFQHCVQVLRHQMGDTIALSNGQGLLATARIKVITKRSLDFEILEYAKIAKKNFKIHLFISPTKQSERMEWLIEKAAEMQVDDITFLVTENSERRKLRLDRLQKKTISALKQSKGAYLTNLHELMSFQDSLNVEATKFIAYLGSDLPHVSEVIPPATSVGLFIGPEGDFSPEEIEKALSHGAQGISLGQSVLRTETAGMLVCHAVNLLNKF